MKRKNHVAILGATGAVGQEMLKILAERKFPIESIKFLASERSQGKHVEFCGKPYPVEVPDENSFKGVNLVLASAGGSISKKYAPLAVRQGAVVIDNTSAFRMDPQVPLVIPEINADQIQSHKGIIANPNCSTIVMLVPLYPLHKINAIRRLYVATYQAASGGGARAIKELETQSRDVLENRRVTKEVFPHQIAFNLFSHNSAVDARGFNEEESKMIRETHKILKTNEMRISVTCIRVPVFRAHSEAIFAEFDKPMSPEKAQELLMKAPGVKWVHDVSANRFPMPLEASGKDDILVGRVRQDLFDDRSLSLFVSGDQIRKGAALNAVQIAEAL